MFLEHTVLEIALLRAELRLTLRGKKGEALVTASDPWEPRNLDGVETYTLYQIWPGIRSLFQELRAAYRKEYGAALDEPAAIQVVGMGRGYIPFDPRLTMLTAYRGAWDPRPQLAAALSEKLGADIPADGALVHLYEAILNDEPYLPYVDYVTTLPGYIHWRLTGFRSLDRGGAAGLFPLDALGGYDRAALVKFDALAAGKLPKPLEDLLPEILSEGEPAGTLTREGVRMLDPGGDLMEDIVLLPPAEAE